MGSLIELFPGTCPHGIDPNCAPCQECWERAHDAELLAFIAEGT